MSQVTTNETPRLKFGERFATAIGQGPAMFHLQMMQMFLLFFYTDVMRLDPAFVAGLFLVVRILDAALTPTFGALVDRVTTPWGKYKPWFVIIGIPLGLFGWLTFTDPGFDATGRIIFVVVSYLVYSIMGAIVSVPTQAVIPVVTKDLRDRMSIGKINFFGVIVGAVLVSVLVQPMYKILGNGQDATGFSILMAVAGTVTVLIAFYQFFGIKERYLQVRNETETPPKMGQVAKAIFSNRTAVIVFTYLFVMNLGNGVRSAITIHYFKYYFHNEGLMGLSGLIALVSTLLGVSLSGIVTKRLGIKNTVLMSVIATLVTMSSIVFVPSSDMGVMLFFSLSVVGTFIGGLASPAQNTMLPAAMDYTEWKTGISANALMGSLTGVLQTFGTAISGAIAAYALVVIGYQPGVEQSPGTITGFQMLISVVPAVLLLPTLAFVWFDLDEKKQAQITADLAKRRAAAGTETQ